MAAIQLKVKFCTHLENQVKLLVHLDNSFYSKPIVISKSNENNKISFNISQIPEESKEDPSIMLHTYHRNAQNKTYRRTKIYRIPFIVLLENQEYVINHEKYTKFRIYLSNFSIKGDFKHKYHPTLDEHSQKLIGKSSNSIFQYLSNNFNFDRLPLVAIFYRDDLYRKMDLLSQLIVTKNYSFSNEEYWLNLLNKYKEVYELLKDFKGANINRRIMKKQRPFNTETSWIDLIMYVVTKGYNYRTDHPKDNYSEPYFIKVGDCIAKYEKVYTIKGLKKVGNLKVGDIVLSYDLKNEMFTYKPILNIWEKGTLQVKRVVFTNGTHIDVTKNHPFWSRLNQQGKSKYGKTLLSDIDFTRFWKKKVPIVKKLPYIIKDQKQITEDHCFIIGFFLADGWQENSHVSIGSKKIPNLIVPLLDKLKIPYSNAITNHNIPYVRILKSKFKEYLKGLKKNSFHMKLYKELLNLPINKLQKILDGYFEGDGHYHKRKNNLGYEKIYSCSCETLVNQFLEISLKIGNPLYKYKQVKDGGLGKSPIYRLHDNQASYFGYEDLSEVGIKKIVDLGMVEMIDFEVQDTHSFVFRNGVIGHNCEDLSLVIIHQYYMFIYCKFKDKVLIEMQNHARKYIPFFTFCLSGTKKFGVSSDKINQPTGHICITFFSKRWILTRLKDEKLIKFMLQNDNFFKLFSTETLFKDMQKHKFFIGESTNIVSPFIENLEYKGFDEKSLDDISKLLKIRARVNFETVSDKVGVRFISDPNSDFYRNFGLMFTPYFYILNPKAKYSTYGFVCATKHEKKNKLPYYGINFDDLIVFNENIMFCPLPPASREFIKQSEVNSRFQIPKPTFKIINRKFESITNEGSGNFYNYTYNDNFFKKLKEYYIKEKDKNYEFISYCFMSDEDMYTEKIRNELIDYLETNKIKMKYVRQDLAFDTSTHFFVFYSQESDIPYLNIIPVGNQFVYDSLPELRSILKK
jgi:hypothetical protein